MLNKQYIKYKKKTTLLLSSAEPFNQLCGAVSTTFSVRGRRSSQEFSSHSRVIHTILGVILSHKLYFQISIKMSALCNSQNFKFASKLSLLPFLWFGPEVKEGKGCSSLTSVLLTNHVSVSLGLKHSNGTRSREQKSFCLSVYSLCYISVYSLCFCASLK